MRRLATATLLGLCLLAASSRLGAQLLPSSPSVGWTPIQVGARVGYDSNSTGTVVGAQMRIPVLPSGLIEVVPNADITFLTGLREYQIGVDAVVTTGGRAGGLYVGGGIGRRNSIYDETSGRETRTTPMIVAGLRLAPVPGLRLMPQFEIRWIRVPDTTIHPRVLTFGFNLPLWGWR